MQFIQFLVTLLLGLILGAIITSTSASASPCNCPTNVANDYTPAAEADHDCNDHNSLVEQLQVDMQLRLELVQRTMTLEWRAKVQRHHDDLVKHYHSRLKRHIANEEKLRSRVQIMELQLSGGN